MLNAELKSIPRASLLLVLTLLFAGLPLQGVAAQQQKIRILAEELASWRPSLGTVLIDTRQKSDYEAGHIPRAIHLKHQGLDSDLGEVAKLLGQAGISGKESIVLYGDGDSYGSLAEFFWWLERLGCKRVRILEGGIQAWKLAGQPLETKPSDRGPVKFLGASSSEIQVDTVWIRDHFGTPGVEIIDTRASANWELYSPPPSFQEGHIPHSLPYDFSSMHGKDGVWLADVEESRKEFAQLGPRPQTRIQLNSVFALYGDNSKDVRPKIGYLLLRMLGIHARVYLRGWKEWSDGQNPIVRILNTDELRGWMERRNPRLQNQYDKPGFLLFDLRIGRDYDLGHIPGAVSFPAYEFQERFSNLIQGEDAPRKSTHLVFYCYGVECVRSRNCATQAARQGFRNLYWFREGYPGWRAAGLPISRPLAGPASD